MKISELMVGDWVYNKHHKKNIRITPYDFFTHIYNEFDEQSLPPYTKPTFGRDLEPIPLTAEILEANGFKKFNFHGIEGQHQWSWWRDTLLSVTLWCRELNDDPKDGWMIRVESDFATHCHKVEFVHEVQHTLRLLGIDKDFKLEG